MKKSTKWKIAIGLIVLQVLALLGNLLSGDNIFMVADLRTFSKLIGFFIPGIIGIILLIQDKKRAKADATEQK